MDPTARFAALVGDGLIDPPLDECAFLIAAHVHAGLDVAAWIARLDELAAAAGAAATPGPSDFDALRHFLFVSEGFRGNIERYEDPANSLLDSVIERRVGIPITLAVVMIEVARRLGIGAFGVGMPGHFLVGDPIRPGRFCDTFSGGVLLDAGECEAMFRRAVGPAHTFELEMLAPVGSRAILARMLANLERSPLAADPVQAAWMSTLHFSIAGLPVVERVALARRVGQLGRIRDAADELDALAVLVSDDAATQLRDEARALRARLN